MMGGKVREKSTKKTSMGKKVREKQDGEIKDGEKSMGKRKTMYGKKVRETRFACAHLALRSLPVALLVMRNDTFCTTIILRKHWGK